MEISIGLRTHKGKIRPFIKYQKTTKKLKLKPRDKSKKQPTPPASPAPETTVNA